MLIKIEKIKKKLLKIKKKIVKVHARRKMAASVLLKLSFYFLRMEFKEN